MKNLLTIVVGFVAYRLALLLPVNAAGCAHFDALTGLPSGISYGCDSALTWGPMEVSILGGHWGQAVLMGIVAMAVLLVWQRRASLMRRRTTAEA
ncbi:MAG TPA: hypothetical protein VFI15_02145 [Candidatus Limnocylindrales bacterium]|nr:hypothetical protein [Candidatus Limnocylindrales bacterium]